MGCGTYLLTLLLTYRLEFRQRQAQPATRVIHVMNKHHPRVTRYKIKKKKKKKTKKTRSTITNLPCSTISRATSAGVPGGGEPQCRGDPQTPDRFGLPGI